MENVVCILRNLSYHVEIEMDPQSGSEDTLDPEWEREQRQLLDEEEPTHTPGCLAFCSRPRRSSEHSPDFMASLPLHQVDFANPGWAV